METSILIAGAGGHGIQSAGKTIVEAAVMAGLNGTCLPKYGIEKRGGFSSCYLVISDDVIGNPKKSRSDIVIVIDERAYGLFGGSVNDSGMLICDSSIAIPGQGPDGFAVGMIAAATSLGDTRSISTIVAGLIMGLPNILPNAEAVREYICSKYKNKPAIMEMNGKAFDIGLALSADLCTRIA